MADDSKPGHVLTVPDSVANDLDHGRDVPIEALMPDHVVEAAQLAQAKRTAPVHAGQLQPISHGEAAARRTQHGETLPNMPATRRVIPEPFRRPRIDISRHGRAWEYVPPELVEPGDTVPGVGQVAETETRTLYKTRAEILGLHDEPVIEVPFPGGKVIEVPFPGGSEFDPDTKVAVGTEVVLTGVSGTQCAYRPKDMIQAFRRQDEDQ